MNLTQKQGDTLAFIRAYIAEKGYAPTYREIGAALGVSASMARYRVNVLVHKGALRRTPGIGRSMSPTTS